MPAPSDELLYKTSINLYFEDVLDMERLHGRGWTEIIRNLVREHVKQMKQQRGGFR